ncbi:MAG TPA: DUF6159 family protein [Solirubrobacterales bacterium]|nr:DUF6159 family protein [Solirubrobacterales bacterium]
MGAETGQTQGGGTPAEGRMARGWRLTTISWALIRREPTMVSIALMGAGCGLAGAAALLYFSGYLDSSTHSQGRLALAAIVGLYPMTFLGVFFNVALAGAAAASFDGRPIGVREALGISWKRLGRIAQWSLLAAGVGLVLEQLASRIPGAGRLASWLLGAAWSLATIFAVPLLALEGPGPLETAKQSVRLIRGKWGEGVTGLIGIGAWTIFATIPVAILLGVGIVIRHNDPTAGAALIAVAIGALLLVSALSLATREVFSVALYRYASGEPGTGVFAAADLEEPFRRRGKDSSKPAS